jgi:GNAT superfamily N-acetyltransferase
VVRLACWLDHPQIAALLDTCFGDVQVAAGGHRETPSSVEVLATRQSELLVMAESDAIIGCVQRDLYRKCLSKLAVHPRSRGTRVGGALVGAVEERALASGWWILRLAVRVEEPELVEYYRRLNYECIAPLVDSDPAPGATRSAGKLYQMGRVLVT